MLNIISYFLIMILLYELMVLHQRIKWGGQYWIGTYLSLNKLHKALEVLENGSIGSYFTLSLKKGSHKFILLKNQNSFEWWFEILINPNKKLYFTTKQSKLSYIYYADLFDKLLKGKEFYSADKCSLPENLPNALKHYRRFIMNNDKQKIIDLLIEYFEKNFNASLDAKIYISFYNTYVEKGIENM